jgi:hypothetical protein
VKRKVLLCMCDAKFTGDTPVRYTLPPAVGDVRRCILLLRDESVAVAEVMKGLGWETIAVATRAFEAGDFDAPEMQPFRQHYDAALRDGHSLVSYL